MGSSSPRCRQSSTLRLPSSTRSIKRLFERGLADAAIGFGEALAVLAQAQIGFDQPVDRSGHFFAFDGRSSDGADRRIVSGVAAERDLIDLFTVLIDTKDADMAEVMVAAGIDAAGNLDVERPDRVFF